MAIVFRGPSIVHDARGKSLTVRCRLPAQSLFRGDGYRHRRVGWAEIDKFIGDGVMALFGLDVPAEIACRQALIAARNMSSAIDGPEPRARRRTGAAAPDRDGYSCRDRDRRCVMGYGRSVSVTAIGERRKCR